MEESGSSFPIAVVGNAHREEFQTACRSMRSLAEVRFFRDSHFEAFIDRVGRDPPFLLICWLQDYPGQYPHQWMDRVRRASPLTRQLVLLGSWCEGEMRTGSPVPGTIRLYWHQWARGGEKELRFLLSGGASGWSLPATSGEEELILMKSARSGARSDFGSMVKASEMHDFGSEPRRIPVFRGRDGGADAPFSGSSAVLAESPAMRQFLLDAVESLGGGALSVSLAELLSPAWRMPPAVLFWDQPKFDGKLCPVLHHLRARFEGIRLVALLDDPRWEEVAGWNAAGGEAVVSKPMRLDDLGSFFRPEENSLGVSR